MRFTAFHSLVAVAALTLATVTAGAADSWKTHYFTNEIATANSRAVLFALSGDANSKTDVKALIGSEVTFCGDALYQGGGTNITLESNIILNVELQPPHLKYHFIGVHGAVDSGVEVLGTLKSIDFEKRVIYIRASPKDYRDGITI
jgi:hypothetical protein